MRFQPHLVPLEGCVSYDFSCAVLCCAQKCKVIANVLLWIPVFNDERQQKQGFKAKRSRVSRIFNTSLGTRVLQKVLSLIGLFCFIPGIF